MGGVCDGNSCINTHDDFYVENEDVGIRSVAGSLSFCFHEAEINLDSSCVEKSNTNEMVYPSELFEEKIETDQHIENRQFHDDSWDLVSNHLLEYEDNTMYVQFDLWSIVVTNKEESDFTFSSHPEVQGELQFDSCNLLNGVEYQTFVFPVEEIHDSVSSDQF